MREVTPLNAEQVAARVDYCSRNAALPAGWREGGRDGGDEEIRQVAGGKNDDVHQIRDRSTLNHRVITEHPKVVRLLM